MGQRPVRTDLTRFNPAEPPEFRAPARDARSGDDTRRRVAARAHGAGVWCDPWGSRPQLVVLRCADGRLGGGPSKCDCGGLGRVTKNPS